MTARPVESGHGNRRITRIGGIPAVLWRSGIALSSLTLVLVGCLIARGAAPLIGGGGDVVPGATLERLDASAGKALVVTSLRTGGGAAATGLRVGDHILQIDGAAATSPGMVSDALAHAHGAAATLGVWRDGHIVRIRMARPAGG